MKNEHNISTHPLFEYDFMPENLTDNIELMVKAAAVSVLDLLFRIPKSHYVVLEAVNGDEPFSDIYLVNLCHMLDLIRTVDDLIEMNALVQKNVIPEFKAFAVLGRNPENLEVLASLVYDYNLEVITQEDLINILLSGEIPEYTSDDPRIIEHPGLLAFSNSWGESHEYQGRWPWPSTAVEPSENPYSDDDGWRDQSDLKDK